MEGKKINVTIPLLKTNTVSRNGHIFPKDVLEKALEEWKQEGMPSVEIEHKDVLPKSLK